MLRRTAPAVLVTLLCALALFATTTATWIHADVPTSLQSVTVDVPGADAAPAVTALGLVAAVAAVASALGGRVLRTIVGAVVALAGVGAVLAVLAVTGDPRAAAQPTVGAQTGVINDGGDYALTGWPWAAVTAAVLLALCGVWLAVVARHARRRNAQRYDRAAVAGSVGTATTTAAMHPRGGEASAGETQAAEHVDDIDTWDALTRGEDPTQTD